MHGGVKKDFSDEHCKLTRTSREIPSFPRIRYLLIYARLPTFFLIQAFVFILDFKLKNNDCKQLRNGGGNFRTESSM